MAWGRTLDSLVVVVSWILVGVDVGCSVAVIVVMLEGFFFSWLFLLDVD